MEASILNSPFCVRQLQDALIVSFPSPARTLSWAVLNGGFCYADHVINHHIDGKNASFCAQPAPWLKHAAAELGLRGKVVAMATAVDMKHLVRVSTKSTSAQVTCFTTVGCGNALSVGDPASMTFEEPAPALHT